MTMVLVVYAHVMRFSLDMRDMVSMFFTIFRMPTFFFISGYIAYKAVECWDASFFRARLKKKAIVQIIPAVVFFVAFALLHGKNPLTEFVAVGFGRFWFTIALFEMFCIYFALSRLGHVTHERVTDVGLVVVALTGVVYFRFFNVLGNDRLLIYQVADYFQYFVFGLMCRKWSIRFLGAMDRRGFRMSVLAAFVLMGVVHVVCWRMHISESPHAQWYRLVFDTLGAYIGVMAMFALFRSGADFFAGHGVVPDMFSFVGRRTLDIYLLHYFFLPELSSLSAWLTSQSSVLLNFAVAFTLACVVTAVSLAVSRVIRLSDFLARYLFGANT